MSNPLHTRRGFHTACLYAFSTPDANVSAAVDATALIGRLRSVGKSWSRWTAQLAPRTSVRRISQGRLHARPRPASEMILFGCELPTPFGARFDGSQGP